MLWFNFILGSNLGFFFVFGYVMYDNNMIISLDQKKIKFEPRIKLNHNIYISYFSNNWPYVQVSIYFKNNVQ